MTQLMHGLVTVAAASGDHSLNKHWSPFPGLVNFPSVVDLKLQDKGLVAMNTFQTILPPTSSRKHY